MIKLPDEFMSLNECAEYGKVTRQAIYVAIRKKQLVATMKDNRWHILRADYDNYRANKYNRDKRIFENEPVYDLEKGHFSVHQVVRVFSETLGRAYSLQHIYYLLRTGQIKGFKKGSSWVILKEDATKLLDMERGVLPDEFRA